MSCIQTHSVRLNGTYPGGKLVLRPVSDADIPLLCELNRDPRALVWADDRAEPYTEETVRDIWGYVSENALCFIIEADDEPVGDCWLQKMNLPDVIARYPAGTDLRRIDLSIGKVNFWNHGIGTSVVRLLTDYAFRVDSADVLHCMCSIANIRSSRIWEKNGFRLVWSEPGTEYEQHYVLRREEYLRTAPTAVPNGMDALLDAHRLSFKNRSYITPSTVCGCFYCQSCFTGAEITKWIDRGQTALCPFCGIDSVLPSGCGYPVNGDFLGQMRKRWFEKESPVALPQRTPNLHPLS